MKKIFNKEFALEKGQRFKKVLNILGLLTLEEQRSKLHYTDSPENINKKFNGERPITPQEIDILLDIIKGDKENHYKEKVEAYFKELDSCYEFCNYQEMLDSLLTFSRKEHKKKYLEEIESNLENVAPLFIYKLNTHFEIFSRLFNSYGYSYIERYCELTEEKKLVLKSLLKNVKMSPGEFLSVDKETKAWIAEFLFSGKIEEEFNKLTEKEKDLIKDKFINKLRRQERFLEVFWVLTGYFQYMNENDWEVIAECLICKTHDKEVYKCLFGREPRDLMEECKNQH